VGASDYPRAMRDELTDLASRLVAIDSVNPDLVPGGAGEGEIARFVAAWCEDHGLETSVEEIAPGRWNVVAVARGSGGAKTLMLNAHMDTVGYAGMDRGLEPRVEGGRLYGRGAYDMKSSLAALLLAGARAKELGLRGDVVLTAVADEEVASIGTAAVAASLRADAAIVTEPTEERVALAHRGFVWLEVETIGRAAHGSLPHLGIDAIAKMGHILVGLEELDRTLRADPSHDLLGSGSLHASLVEGGVELSTYPDRCVLQAERRTIPGESAEAVAAEVQAIVDRAAAADPDVRAEVRTTFVREPFEVDRDEAVVQSVLGHAAATLGREAEVVGVPFWADAAILSAAGIPTVVYGPVGEGAHADVEWVDLESAARCGETYLAVAAELCA
jgi:acetylornithine deacetylase